MTYILYIISGYLIWKLYLGFYIIKNILSLKYNDSLELKLLTREDLPEYLWKVYEPTVLELNELGFNYQFSFSRSNIYIGIDSTEYYLLLYNPENYVFAIVGLSFLQIKHLDPIDVSFNNNLSDGRKLVSYKCFKNLVISEAEKTISFDSLEVGLKKHYNFHLEKLNEIKVRPEPIDFAQNANDFILRLSNEYKSIFQNKKIFWFSKEGYYIPKFKSAFNYYFRSRQFNSQYKKILKELKQKKTYFEVPVELAVEDQIKTNQIRDSLSSSFLIKLQIFFLSLFIFFLSYYFILGDIEGTLILTAVLIFHEFGHALLMKYYGYKNIHVFFIPFVGAIASTTERKIPTWKHLVILFAGPLPGIIIAGLLIYFKQPYPYLLSYLLVLNYFNLLPVYPLDGGQILEKIIFARNYFVKVIFLLFSLIISLYVAYKLESIPTLVISFVLCLMLLNKIKLYKVIQELKEDRELLELEERDLIKKIILAFRRHKIQYTSNKIEYLEILLSEKKCSILISIIFLSLYLALWAIPLQYYYKHYGHYNDYWEENEDELVEEEEGLLDN